MRRLAIVLPLALLLVAPAARAADQTVNATGSSTWSPASVTIDVQDTVTWKNQGGIHNVVFDDGSFTEPDQPSGTMWSVSRTFTAAGTFKYHCGFHGTAMAGTVVVQQPGGGGTPPPDTTPPDIDSLRLVPARFCNKKTKVCKTVGTMIRFDLDEDARISGRIVDRKTGKKRGSISITATRGENEFDYSGKGLPRGKYRLELFAKDAAGNRTPKPTRASFTIAASR